MSFLVAPSTGSARSCKVASDRAAFRQEKKQQTRKRILKCVRHHAWTQTLPQVNQNSEERTVDSDHNHHAITLVTVTQAKDDSREKNSAPNIPGQSGELALQVATKNNFLKEPGAKRQDHEECGF